MIATLGLDAAAPLALAPGAEPVFRLSERP
jgi:hypothetical protein